MKTEKHHTFGRLVALLLFTFIFSCTANKKVVDDEFATDTASEDTVATDDAVSEDDLFAENSMSDAGSESNNTESAPAEPNNQASSEQSTEKQSSDDFSDFEESAPEQNQAATEQNAGEQPPPPENLDDLDLESDPIVAEKQNAEMTPSPESLADEQPTEPPPPETVVETPAPEVLPPANEIPVEPVPEVSTVSTPEPVPESSTDDTTAVVPPTEDMALIREVQFRGNENGGALVIKANKELQYTTRLNSTTNQVVLEISNASVPKKLMRPLITKDMSSSIGTIDIYQRPNSSVARFVIQLRADSPEPLVQPEGDTILVIGTPMMLQKAPVIAQQIIGITPTPGQETTQVIPSPGQQSSPEQVQTTIPAPQIPVENKIKSTTNSNQAGSDLGQLPNSVIPLQLNGSTVDVSRAKGIESGTNLTLNQDIYTKGLLSSRDLQDFLTNNNRYYGKKISIVTQDLEVRDVLNFISEEASINLIYDDDVSGKVNIKLRRVPWDQALVTLLKSKKLGYQRQGSILRIARLDSLLREEDEAVKIRDARIDQEPLVVRNFRINYAEIKELETKIQDFIMNGKKEATNRGRVSSDARTNTIIVTETPTKLKQVEELILALDTQPQQVQIEARVIEASETFSKNVGVKWGLNSGKSTITPFDRGPVATQLKDTDFFAMPSSAMTPGAGFTNNGLNSSLWFGRIGAFGDLELALSLGQAENKVKVLSSPRIVVLSGTSATVNQSLKVNVPDESATVAPTGGGTTTVVKTKIVEGGVSLNVTPQISNIDTVRLKLNISKTVVANTKGDTSSRNASSEVILKSMQTAVIGGVFESQQIDDRQGVPGIQDIPVLGALFRGKAESTSKSELMIFVTPKILPPLTLPTDMMTLMPQMVTPPAATPTLDQSMNSQGSEQQLTTPPPDIEPVPSAPPVETSEEELSLD